MPQLFSFYSKVTTAISSLKGDGLTNPMRKYINEPFFQYKVGPHRGDYYLYFKKEPFPNEYYNRIFSVIAHSFAYESIDFIQFHLHRSPNRERFLSFLFYELSTRVKQLSFYLLPTTIQAEEYRIKKLAILENALLWVKNIREEETLIVQSRMVEELTHNINVIVNNHINRNDEVPREFNYESLNEKLSDLVKNSLEQIKNGANNVMDELSEDYPTGSIKALLNNSRDSFIVVMLILQDLKFMVDNQPQLYFKDFRDIDIAKIMRLHFSHYRVNKIELDGIRKEVSAVRQKLYQDKNDDVRHKLDMAIKTVIERL